MVPFCPACQVGASVGEGMMHARDRVAAFLLLGSMM
jgi:hypothetical protein